MISLLPRFFDRNRGFALGFVLAGNGIGGLVLSPMTQSLIDKIGIRWTLRVLGLMTLLMMTPVAFVLRQAPGFEERRHQRDAKATTSSTVFRKPEFYAQVYLPRYPWCPSAYACILQALGTAMQAAGNIIPLYYLNTFAISVLGYSVSAASILLAINNVANSTSRVLMGLLADRIGRQNTLIASVS